MCRHFVLTLEHADMRVTVEEAPAAVLRVGVVP